MHKILVPLSISLFQLIHFLQTASMVRNLEARSTCQELVGNLQTCEVNHCLITTKSAEEDADAKLDCDSNDADFEALFI